LLVAVKQNMQWDIPDSIAQYIKTLSAVLTMTIERFQIGVVIGR